MGKDGKKILWEELLGIYEDHLSDKLGELLSSEKFIKALQIVLTTSEEFRRLLLKIVEIALSNLELPTGQDFSRLYQKVSDLDDSMFELRSAIHELRRKNESISKEIEDKLNIIEKELKKIDKSSNSKTKKKTKKTTNKTTPKNTT